MKFKDIIVSVSFLVFFQSNIMAQGGGGSSLPTVAKLPEFIPPAPEAAALVKADNLSVGYTTGSPNIRIPICNLQVGSYNLPITINYSSTGIKIDETASMVGMGWNLEYGGVISRTVLGVGDEYRSGSSITNLNPPSFGVKNQALLDFLNSTTDKESDIFSFSFPGYSGKFILDQNKNPIQLTKNNLLIENINNNFTNGFKITTDNGTAYYFQDAEISKTRLATCGKSAVNTNLITSWYLTKIELPSRQKHINFSYTSTEVSFQTSVSQTVSKVIGSGTNECSNTQACQLIETFSECINGQIVEVKFLTSIVSSDGDKIDFFYDANTREDFFGAKKLNSIKSTSRNGNILREAVFTTSYQTAITSTGAVNGYYDYRRLFLENVKITGSESTSTSPYLNYSFQYFDYGSLPPRFAYAQDLYGYYNGKVNNDGLLPQQTTSDPNYNVSFTSAVKFGDRSIDENYSYKGMLKRITYPTGGYEEISYAQNKYLTTVNSVEVEKLTGGVSVSRIISYMHEGTNNKALDKEFIYRFYDNNKLSAKLISEQIVLNRQFSKKTDGYVCNGVPYFSGASCTYAVITSNPDVPLSAIGTQHIYFESVLEKNIDGTDNNGLIEHKYAFAFNLFPSTIMGTSILICPMNVVPDVLKIENFTNIYKKNGSFYTLVKSTEKQFTTGEFITYSNFIVKKNYTYTASGNPITDDHFDTYDVSAYTIMAYNVRVNKTIEKTYPQNGTVPLVVQTDMEYNPLFTYPAVVKTKGSDDLELKTEYKYPQNYTTLGIMLARNVVSPVIEEKHFKNGNLLVTKTQTYLDWFNNGDVIVPQSIEVVRPNASPQKIVFYSYDANGNPVELSKEDDIHMFYFWDATKTYPLAMVKNTSAGQAAYTSFEENNQSWTYTGASTNANYAITGKKIYILSNGPISKSGLTIGKNYIVSYWSRGASQNVSGSTSMISQEGFNGWYFYQHTVNNLTSTSIQISGTGTIDELRLYPQGAQMSSFTYEPLVGVTSQCDENNKVSYFQYDVFNRLFLIRDQRKNILKKICYNYAGQPENCTVSTIPQWANTTTTIRCKVNVYNQNTGEQEQEQIDNNPYSATYLETQWVVIGTNTTVCPPPSCPSCSGVDKKCINGICRTGTKVYTEGNYDPLLRKHVCTYHYEWIDGSWSQNYQEISNTACPLS